MTDGSNADEPPRASLWQRAVAEPDRVAVVEVDGHPLTFAEVARAANRLANALVSRGARRGDHLCSMLRNGSLALEVIAASWQIGLHYTPVNFHLSVDDVAYMLADSGATFFVAAEECAEVAEPALVAASSMAERTIIGLSAGAINGFTPLDAAMAAASPELPEERSVGARMYYSSGTTGRPKGVERVLGTGDVDDASVAHAVGLWAMGMLDPHDSAPFLQCGPLYHPSPMGFAIGALNLGKTVVVTDGFDAEHILSLVEQHQCDASHMVPTMFVRLLKLPDDVRTSYDVSSLRGVVHAAAPCSVDVKRRMIDWLGPIVHEYYSSTEGVGGARVTAQDWLSHVGTVGQVEPGSMVAMDDEGNVLRPGEVGVLYANRTFEYHNDATKTASSRRGGWSTVGDIGYIDSDGWLFLVDRVADVINSGGVNIYPAEVESVLLQHAAVADVAVVGVPNDEFGEEVKAVVVLMPGVALSPELAGDVLTFVRDRAPHYRCPRSVDFVDDFPRDDNGKLHRRKVRARYWQGRSSQIV
jgi:long-chain acyl-CoA synthetase